MRVYIYACEGTYGGLHGMNEVCVTEVETLQDANEEIQKIRDRDNFKNNWCLLNNIKLFRIPYYDENKLNINYFKERGILK